MKPDSWWTGFVTAALDPATAVDVVGQLLVSALALLGAIWLLRTQLRHDRLASEHARRAEDARRLADEIYSVRPVLGGSSEHLGQYVLNHRQAPFAELTEGIRRRGDILRIGFESHPIRRRLTELTVLWRMANNAKMELRHLPPEAVGYALRALLSEAINALEQCAGELRSWDGASAVAPASGSAFEGLMPPETDLDAREEWRSRRRCELLKAAHRRAGVRMAPAASASRPSKGLPASPVPGE